MTSAGKPSKLSERVLVHLADKCRAKLDQVKVGAPVEVLVHDILKEFGKCEGASPSAVRVVLLDWIAAGCVKAAGIEDDPDLLCDEARVTVRVRGIVLAREFVDRGVPTKVLRLKHKLGHGDLECAFDTGNAQVNRELNKSGASLACFYLLSAIEPKGEKPLVVEHCEPMLQRLVKHGVRRRSGPKAETGSLSAETIRGTFTALRAILPLKQGWSDADERVDYWYLETDFPDVWLVPSSPDGYQHWDQLRSAVFRIVRDENYMLPSGEWMRPDGKLVGSDRAASPEPPATATATD